LKDWADQRGMLGAIGLGGNGAAPPPAPGTPAPGAQNPTAQAPATPTSPAPGATPPAPVQPTAPTPVAVAAADAAATAPPPAAPVAHAAPDAHPASADNHPAEDKTAHPPVPEAPGKGQGEGSADKKDDDDDPDEEELLRKAEPNAENAVIGEEEAEAPPAPKPGAKKIVATLKPKAPPAKPDAPAPAQPAKVQTAVLHITSAPEGAIVRTKARVLGRTPINLHFKTGNTYELKLVKRGYTPATRKVAVNNAKDRKIAVRLKKKPVAKKRSFFHPHR
jgi:hypothetical protein